MAQACINPKADHVPVIERYFDEERPTEVMRIFRCEKCGYVMERDVIFKWDDEIVHEGYEAAPEESKPEEPEF